MVVTVVPPAKLWVMTPCRAYDSRSSYYGKLQPGDTYTLRPSYWCYQLYSARALALNVTVVEPTQAGYVTLFPAGISRPSTTTASFRAGKTRANNAVIGLSSTGYLSVYNGSTAPIDFIIDVFAYFQ